MFTKKAKRTVPDAFLKKIEYKYKLNNVFISGSASEYGDMGQDLAVELMHSLSKELVKNEYRVISGFGLGVGSYIINGALEEIYNSKYKHVDEYLTLRPFPQYKSGKKDLFELWQEYREDMIKDAGVVIFLFGNKKDDDKVIMANGVITEFKIAQTQAKSIIPIGSTGYASYEVFQEVKKHIGKYWYLKDSIDILESEKDPTKLITEVIKIINRIRGI